MAHSRPAEGVRWRHRAPWLTAGNFAEPGARFRWISNNPAMAIRLGSTVINVADLETMTRFWSQALHLAAGSDDPTDAFRVLRGDRVNLSLQLAQTPVSARDQMHLDLYTDDQAAEVTRLAGLGARTVRHVQERDDDYVVMTDPEGNEFCVVAVAHL